MKNPIATLAGRLRTEGSGASSPPESKKRPQLNLRTMIALVACAGLVLWAWRRVWEANDPVLAEARALQSQAIRALGSKTPAARLSAIRELDRLGFGDSAVAVRPMIGLLNDEDKEVRLAAFEALGDLGASAVKAGAGARDIADAGVALIAALKDPDPKIRQAAAIALKQIYSAEPGGRGPLRRGSIRLLGPGEVVSASDRTQVIDALVQAFGDKDVEVRGAVLAALASISETAAAAPLRALVASGKAIPPASLASGAATAPRQVLAIGLADESPEIRRAAVFHATNAHWGVDRWIPTLLRLAEQDPSPLVRQACRNRIGGVLGPPGVTAASVPALAAALGSKDPQLRIQVAALLGRLGPTAAPAIPGLLKILKEPPDTQVSPIQAGDVRNFDDDPVDAAAEALGQIAPGSNATKEVVAALLEVARTGTRIRRGYAVYALGQFGPDAAEAIPVLLDMVKETGPTRNDHNVAPAAWALGRIAPGTPSADEAVAALLPLIESNMVDTPMMAIEALGRFGENAKAAGAVTKIRAVMKAKRNALVKDSATKALKALESEGS